MTGNESSIVDTSLENLFIILPIGFKSKNLIAVSGEKIDKTCIEKVSNEYFCYGLFDNELINATAEKLIGV